MIAVRQRLACFVWAAVAVAMAPMTASADDAPAVDARPVVPALDTVYLGDGRVLRGAVVDVVPHVALEFQLANGELVVIPHEQVMRFERGPRVPVAPLPRPDAAARRVKSAGWVHIDTPTTASLERAEPYGPQPGAWVTVCVAPCDRPLPTDGAYRIVGAGLKTSDAFGLGMIDGESATLHVHGASPAGFHAGIATLVAGPSLALATTVAIVLVGSVARSEPLSDGERTAVELSLGAGLVSALVGAALLVVNASTSVSQDVVPVPSGTASLLPRLGPREGTLEGTRAALRPVAEAPLVTLHF
jgi:hypothetical protein